MTELDQEDYRYATKVHFVEVGDGGIQPSNVSWPCVVFKNMEELRSSRKDMLSRLGHGAQEEAGWSLDLKKRMIANMKSSDPCEESSTAVSYLLGKKTPGNRRLLVVSELQDFQSNMLLMRTKFNGFPGFDEAMAEALELINMGPSSQQLPLTTSIKDEPELSKARARFVEIKGTEQESIIPWPAIIFHDFLRVADSLKTKGILSGETAELWSLAREILKIAQEALPPYVYFFGQVPGGRKVAAMGSGCGLHAYETAIVDAHSHINYPGFSRALNELMVSMAPAANGCQLELCPGLPAANLLVQEYVATSPTKVKPRATALVKAHKNLTRQKTKKRGPQLPLTDVSSKPPGKKCKRKEAPKAAEIPREKPGKAYEYSNIKEIPTFAQVRPVLIEAGYSFNFEMFCFPDGEGAHYLESEAAFRADLCSYGIRLGKGIRPRRITEKEEDPGQLAAWVCYHRLAKMLQENGKQLSDVPRVSPEQGRAILEKLGFLWKSGKWHHESTSFPYEDEVLMQDLACNGIPDFCDTSSVPFTELAATELFLSCPTQRSLSIFVSHK